MLAPLFLLFIVLQTAFERNNIFVRASSCDGTSCGVPEFLSSTYINVAASSAGATCTAIGGICERAIDGNSSPSDKSWYYDGAINHFIKITFIRTFTVDTIRLKQRGYIYGQYKEIVLEFSGGESRKLTLKRNTGSSNNAESFWEVLYFAEVKAKWVNIRVSSIYASHNNGFREVEFYKRNALEGKVCERLNMVSSGYSKIEELFGRTVSMVLKSDNMVTVLHESSPSSKKYRFVLGKNNLCALEKDDGSGNVTKKSVSCAGLLSSTGIRPLWIDFRCSNIILGSGNEIILQWKDSTPLDIYAISFLATTTSEITLCHREDRCLNDADHYWPMDRVTAGQFLDHNGDRSFMTNITNDEFATGTLAFKMFSLVPQIKIIGNEREPFINLGDFSGQPINDPDRGDFTLAFWTMIPTTTTASTRIIYSSISNCAKLLILYVSDELRVYVHTRTMNHSRAASITKGKYYHVVLIWSKKKNSARLTINGYLQKMVQNSHSLGNPDDPYVKIGVRNGETYRISDIILWKRELSVYEVESKFACTRTRKAEVSCSPFLKKACGNGYSQQQCLSIGCCYSGGACFMADGDGDKVTIPSFATASSFLKTESSPLNGRIIYEDVPATGLTNGWRPESYDTSSFFQLDAFEITEIGHVVVLGSGNDYVKTFTISHSKSCAVFTNFMDGNSKKLFTGNTNGISMVTVDLPSTIKTRCVRIEPKSFQGNIVLRAKLLGKKGPANRLGCYVSGSFMPTEGYDSSSLTPDKCIVACGKAIKTHAALTSGRYCYCANSLTGSTKVSSSRCIFPCSGNPRFRCGGRDVFDVYTITGSFESSLSCSLPSNVTIFATLSGICSQNSAVSCDFGESLPAKAENKAVEFMYYTSPAAFQVICKGSLETGGVSDENYVRSSISVYDDFEVDLDCPKYVPKSTPTDCLFKVLKGTGVSLSYQLTWQKSGREINLCDTISLGSGEVFDADDISEDPAKGTTVLLLNTVAPDKGRFVGIDLIVESTGCMSIQIVRPICGSGPYSVYQYSNGNIEKQQTNCSSLVAGNCINGQMFSLDFGLCTVQQSLADNSTAFLSSKLEVAASKSVCFTKTGRHKTFLNNVSTANFEAGDIFALYFPKSSPLKISSRKLQSMRLSKTSSVLTLSQENSGVGSILTTSEGTFSYKKYSISFLNKITCSLKIPLNYSAIGVFDESITVKSSMRSKKLSAKLNVEESVDGVSWYFKAGAIHNEQFSILVKVQSGSHMRGVLRFNNISSHTVSIQTQHTFVYTFTKRQLENISLIVYNNVSLVYKECQVWVRERVKGLAFTRVIAPIKHPAITNVCFKLTAGDQVTIKVDYGYKRWTTRGPFNIRNKYLGCFRYFHDVGVYVVAVNASNDASQQNISQIVIVEKEIKGLSCTLSQQFAHEHIEVKERICFHCSKNQGTTPTFLVSWGDGTIETFRREGIKACHSFPNYNFYDIRISVFNNVSRMNFSETIQVHKPVYPLVNFSIVCPPRNLTDPTNCVQTIGGGNDFNCTWDFGDGQRAFSNDSHVEKPITHSYANLGYYTVTIDCANRLYNTKVIVTPVIVETPMLDLTIGEFSSCPLGHTSKTYVAVKSGSGVHFRINKTNLHTGKTEQLTPVFNKDHTNGSVTFQCNVVGVYYLEATSVNNVTALKSFVRYFKVDQLIGGALLVRMTPQYVRNLEPSVLQVSISRGTNVTCYFDFKDGTITTLFRDGHFPSKGENITHTYKCAIDALVPIICNNSVSQVSFNSVIKVQYPHKDVFLVCSNPQPFPPGKVNCTFDTPTTVPFPTNSTCTLNFGDSEVEALPFEKALTMTHYYAQTGWYDLNATCINDVSKVSLSTFVQVETPIDSNIINIMTTGGIYEINGQGKGDDNSYFPSNRTINVDVDWGNGTNVTLMVKWGDSQLITETKNNTCNHVYYNAGSYTAIVTMKNALGSFIKSFPMNIQNAVFGFTFTNNGPVALQRPLYFIASVDEIGTSTCFKLDLGNGTSFLYKPSDVTICEPDCNYGAKEEVYSSLPLNISYVHKYIGNYEIRATACNKVSKIEIESLANVSPKPCKYPKVNFSSFEANTTARYAIQYRRSIQIPVTPIIKIDCEATKYSRRKWDIEKCNEDGDPQTCKDLTSNCSKTINMNNPSLQIPPRCLIYGLYRLSAEVEMLGGGTKGIFVRTFGWINITKTPLTAVIAGGSSRAVGYNKSLTIDGTLSTDPDTGDNKGMQYVWFCHDKNEPMALDSNSSTLQGMPATIQPELKKAVHQSKNSIPYSGCFGYGPGRLNLTGGKIEIRTDGMRIGHNYEVVLKIIKDTRWSSTRLSLQIVEGTPPNCEIRCIVGCDKKINPSDKHGIQVDCICDDCYDITYNWRIFKQNKTNQQMDEILNPENLALTPLTFNNLAIKPNALQGDEIYDFIIEATDVRNKVMGFSGRNVITNPGPRNGSCDVNPKKGDSETKFNISCPDWLDDDEYFTFSINYYDKTTDLLTPIYKMRSDVSTWYSSTLSVGDENQDYNNTLRVFVCDPWLSCSKVDLEIQVTLKETNEEEFQTFIQSLVDIDGQIPILMGEGRVDELCAYIFKQIGNLKMIQEIKPLWSDYTKGLIVKAAEFCMNATCQIVSSDPKKAACKSAVINLILTVNATLTEHTKKTSLDCLMEAAKDISSFPPSELEASAGGMVSALAQSLTSTAVSPGNGTNNGVTTEDAEKSEEEQMKQSMGFMNTFNGIGGALQSMLIPGEKKTIFTKSVTMISAKTSAKDLKTVSSESGGGVEGLSNAIDPNSKETIGVKMLQMDKNPYGWAGGASQVNSPVLDFSLSGEDSSPKPINKLSEPISVMFSQPGKKIQLRHHKLDPQEYNIHNLQVTKNHSSIHVEFIPENENVSYHLFLRRNACPTPTEHEYNYTLNFTNLNTTDGLNPNMWFLSNEELNYTAAGTWKIMVSVADKGVAITQLGYNISIFTAACMFFNKTTKSFSTAGMKVGPKTTRDVTQCLSTHATSFASDFFVPPNSIDWDKISLDELMNNPIVFIVVMVIFGLYFLLLIWARRADKKDLDKIGLTPLPDNDPRDTYLYEIVVYTGHSSGAGTTSNVYIILAGGLDETSPKKLCDPDPARKKFCKGAVDYFLLAVPRSLGKLKKIHIWHTNEGSEPSWFLQRIMVRDLQSDNKTWFVNLRWLAVEEDDGMIERTIYPATKEELTNFGLLFCTEARKNLTDNHLWFSVVTRPPKSTFTRVQRLSCCLSVILTTMVANAMFYQVDDTSSTGTSIHIGPFSFSIRQVSIGITSSLVVLPVNVIVVSIFRKIKPPDPKSKEARETTGPSGKYKLEAEKPKICVSECEVNDDVDEQEVKEDIDEDEEEEIMAKDQNTKTKETKKKKTLTLSPKYAYLAYALIFIASTVSATFTVFYGLTFGKEKSEGWISSIMISFWQDVLISQPLKVFAAAMFFALVIKDPNKNEDENEQQNELNPDEELVHKNVQNSEEEKTLRKIGFVAKPPDPVKLENFRKLRLKQKQMKAIIYEIVQYLFFLMLVLVIAYGNRDPMAYGVTRAMDGFFIESDYTEMSGFDGNDRPSKYWSWVLQSYLPTLRPYYWYGPVEKFNESSVEFKTYDDDREILFMEQRYNGSRWVNTNGNYVKNATVLHSYPRGFVADHATAYLVGSARIRQLRIQRNQSKILPLLTQMFGESNADYDWDLEDTKNYHPSWKPFESNDTKDESSDSPWYYRSSWELKGTPYWGFFSSYWGGGYVVDLGSDRLKAEEIVANLSALGWIDKYSRALFAEFTVYNPYTNFFSAVTLLTEIRASGGYFHSPKVQTLRLYRYIGPEMVFVMACEISYIAFLLYFLFKQVKKYREERRLYFQDGWNYLEIAVLSFSISSVGLYFARLGMTTYTISNMKDTPNRFVSFQYVAFLDEWVSATCSLAVFFSFLKFLRLLRFNRRMALLSLTLKRASKPLFYFFVYFAIIFLAYVQFGFSMFGASDVSYASFHRSIVTVFSMTLGDFDFDALRQANRIFGPLFFFSYVVLIMFILMNVFLSILVDNFDEVNRDVLQQGNDHEMLAFMVHAVKSNIGKKCGPAIKPTYVEEKSGLEKAVDDIDDISDNIQYAIINICLEDIRQEKWFDPKKTTRKKNLVVQMLIEDEENLTENYLCDAIPLLDEFIANHSLDEIAHCLIAYREKKRLDEMAEDSKDSALSSGSSDEDSGEEETEMSDDEVDSVYSIIHAKSKRGSRRNSQMI